METGESGKGDCRQKMHKGSESIVSEKLKNWTSPEGGEKFQMTRLNVMKEFTGLEKRGVILDLS